MDGLHRGTLFGLLFSLLMWAVVALIIAWAAGYL